MVGTSECASDLAYNDDFCGTASQVTLTAGPGDVWVTVDGFRSFFDPLGECGPYTLDIISICDSTNVVTTAADSGPGSLRNVIAEACPGSTITFDPGLTGDTILLFSEIIIDKELEIHGLGMDALFISGQEITRVFSADIVGAILIRDLSIVDGYVFEWFGAGITHSAGELTLQSVRFKNCNATWGGGAIQCSQSILIVQDCDFDSNQSNATPSSASSMRIYESTTNISGSTFRNGIGGSGAIHLYSGSVTGSTCTISHSTISGNAGAGIRKFSGGGIINCSVSASTIADNSIGISSGSSSLGSISLSSTIVADNFTDLDGTATNSLGYNLIESAPGSFTADATDIVGEDPGLLPLADNGGSTLTHALNSCSPAIEAGDPADLSADQAGQSVFGIRDIGAFEYQGFMESELVVTNTADSGPGSLRDVIATACAGVPITFDPSLTGDTIVLVSQIILHEDLVLNGLGMNALAISGGNLTSIFSSNANINVKISDVAIINTIQGIRQTAGQLTLESVRFRNCKTGSQGGAVQIRATAASLGPSSLVVEGCDFADNEAQTGSSIYARGTNVTIGGSTFRNGIETNASLVGAAIWLGNDGFGSTVVSTCSVDRSTITGNS